MVVLLAIFPVGFAFFYQGAEAFLGIFEAVELVQEDVHGLFQAIAQGEAHAAEAYHQDPLVFHSTLLDHCRRAP